MTAPVAFTTAIRRLSHAARRICSSCSRIAVPPGREPAPHRHQLRRVERVDDQRNDRYVEEGEAERHRRGHEDGAVRVHPAPALFARTCRNTVIGINRRPKHRGRGGHEDGAVRVHHAPASFAWKCMEHHDRDHQQQSTATATAEAHRPVAVREELVPQHPPDHQGVRPPEQGGITNSPTAGMKTSMEPAMMPGAESGRVIAKNAFTGRQPRSAAASRRVGSSRSRFA